MRTKLLICAVLLCCMGSALAQDGEKCGKNSNTGEGMPADCNGISVGAPKVFDNLSLTLMLEKLNQNLQSQKLNFIDPTTLKAALANLQGLSTSETSVSGSVTGNPTPALTEGTTFNSGNVDANGNRVPNTFQRTTSANQAAVTPQAPGFDTLPGLPSGFNPTFGSSASDLLNDQANLNYQIVNLQMILERSLSDRTLNRDDPNCVDTVEADRREKVGCTRLQAVLGFNITIDPPRTANDAVAVVEIVVCEISASKPCPSVPVPNKDNGGLSLVALMPQEKTYNAAALSTNSHAFSGAAVAGAFQIGASARKRAQVFYLYRDTDTLSYERMTDAGELVFGWMFRPVLGRRSVSPGLRNMFAVLALPNRDCAALDEQENKTNPEHPCQAELRTKVRTYWKKYDRNTMTSFTAANANRARNYWYNLSFDQARPQLFGHHGYQNGLDYIDLPVYSSSRYERLLSPKVDSVEWISTGAKSVVVLATGNNFFTDTAVTLGDKVYTNPSGGLNLKSNQSFDLTTSIDQLVDGPGAIMGRYGVATPLILDRAPSELAPCGMKIVGATTTPPIAGVRSMDITLQSGKCVQAPPQPPTPKLQEAAALAQAAVTTARATAEEAAQHLADEEAKPHSPRELALPGFEKRQAEALKPFQAEVDRTNESLANAVSHREIVSNNIDFNLLPKLKLSKGYKLLQTPIVSVNGTALDLPYDVYPEVTKSTDKHGRDTGDIMRVIVHVNFKDSLLADGGATVKVTWPFYNTDKWTSTLRFYTPTLGFEVTRVSDKSIVISRITGEGISFSNAPENLSKDKPDYACWRLIAGETAIPLRTDACPCPPTDQPRSCEKKPTPKPTPAKSAEAKTGSSDKDQSLDLGSALPYTVSATVAKMPSHVILLAPNGTAYRLTVPDLTDKKAAPPAPPEMKQGDAAWIPITVPVGKTPLKTPLKVEANGKDTLQIRPAAKDDSKPADPKVQTFNVEITRDLTAKTGTIDLTVLDKDSKPIAGTVPQKITITCSQCTDKTADKGDK